VHAGTVHRSIGSAAPPAELVPAFQSFFHGLFKFLVETAQTAEACASYYLRVVGDPNPALRCLTHPPSEELVRAKLVDVDGSGIAAAVLGTTGERQGQEAVRDASRSAGGGDASWPL